VIAPLILKDLRGFFRKSNKEFFKLITKEADTPAWWPL